MQLLARNLSALTFLLAAGHGSADVIYSGSQDTPIALSYDGIKIDVDFNGTWDLNPYLGGVYLANNTAFQPARDGSGGMDTVTSYATGVLINGSLSYATGMGGSIDHLGSTFTAGQEGYLGFKLGANYGWMRVVFTNNTSGAVIKDWAYDTSPAAVATGNVLQSGSTITLDSSALDFALGSQVGGSNSVVKNGINTATLTGVNPYTGATTVNFGTLIVNGNISTSNLTTVSSGATLAGTGTVGATSIQGGATLSPGEGVVGTLTVSTTLSLSDSSILDFDFDPAFQTVGAGVNDLVTGITDFSLDGILNVMATSGNFLGASSGDAWRLFNYTGVLSDGALSFGTMPSLGSGLSWSVDTSNTGQVNLTVIPEPHTAALMGGLAMLALLRRRR